MFSSKFSQQFYGIILNFALQKRNNHKKGRSDLIVIETLKKLSKKLFKSSVIIEINENSLKIIKYIKNYYPQFYISSVPQVVTNT